jgi:hypothetical protein
VKNSSQSAGVHRSKFYYLLNPISPIDHAVRAKADIVGSVFIIVLLLGGISLVRMVLSGVH